MSLKNGNLSCDMIDECSQPVSHIDEKGFVYCKDHGLRRKATHRCRQLKPAESKRLKTGEPLPRY